MATPIVHASLGLVIASAALMTCKSSSECTINTRKKFALYGFCAMFLACLPDIDIPISYILTGDVRTYHFGITHSLFFCVVVGLLLRIKLASYYACVAFFLVLSHVVADSFTGKAFGLSETAGIRLFMPFSEYVFVANFTLFPGVEHSNWWSRHNMLRVLYDTVLFVPPALVFVYLAIKQVDQRSPSTTHEHKLGKR